MEQIKKRLLGVEDVNWDTTGGGETENFTGSDGEKVLHKVNESHIPVSRRLRDELSGASTLTQAFLQILEKLKTGYPSSGNVSGGMAEDKTVSFSSSMSAAEIQNVIDDQEKNLGNHTITFQFPENYYQNINQTISFSDFYNGKIVVDGNGGTIRDTGDIGSIFLFDFCLCYIDFNNFTVEINYCPYGIETKASLGVFINNCHFEGNENVYGVYAVMSDAVYGEDCTLTGGCKKISGYFYNFLDKNFLSLSGGDVKGDLKVNAKNVLRSVNNILADDNGAISVKASDVGALPVVGGTMVGDITFSVSGGKIYNHSDTIVFNLGQTGLYIYGASHKDVAGKFNLEASDGTNSAGLIGSPDAVLTWNGKNIARSVNGIYADSKGDVALTASDVGALPSVGGHVSGSISYATDNERFFLCGATSGEYGSYLSLNGGGFEGFPGGVVIVANDGTKSMALGISPDGILKWGDEFIVRTVNGKPADPKGAVSITASDVGAIPSTGGTITGNLLISGASFVAVDDSRYVDFKGGRVNGAAMACYGSEFGNIYFDSCFAIRSGKNADDKTNELIGRPNGELTWLNKDITLGYPDFSAQTTEILVNKKYIVEVDGWLMIAATVSGNGWCNIFINNKLVGNLGHGSGYDFGTSIFIPVKKSDILSVSTDVEFEFVIHSYPNRGV